MQWKQIALPCKPPNDKNTVASIFGDTIKAALNRDAIINKDYALYSFDGERYKPLAMDSKLDQGVGYWIIQGTGGKVDFQMPAGSKSTRGTKVFPFYTFRGIPLKSVSGSAAWSMVGNPFAVVLTGIYVDFEGYESESTCLNPGPACRLGAAHELDIVHKTFYRYNAAIKDYDKINEGSGAIGAWDGFWVATLSSAAAKDYVELILGRNSGT